LAPDPGDLDAEADGTTVLGVVLPGASGFDILRCIRAASRIPVLMLIARGDDVNRIVGPEPEVPRFGCPSGHHPSAICLTESAIYA